MEQNRLNPLEILLCILYVALFVFIIHKVRYFQLPGLSSKTIAIIFGIKVLFGAAMYFIYTHYYPDRNTADIFKYFDDSKVMYDAFWQSPGDFFQMLFGINNDNAHFNSYYMQMNNWFREYESTLYNDGHTIIRFNAALRFASFGYYNVHMVFMCFLSLIGLVGIYKALHPFFERQRKELTFAVFLIPSVLFWGSGVLKEGLLIFGLGVLIYQLFKLIKGEVSIFGIAAGLAAMVLLLYVKFYVLAAMIPGLIAYIWCKKQPRWPGLKYLAVGVVCSLMALNLYRIAPQFDVLKLLARKQKDFIGLVEYHQSGSSIELTPLTPTLSSFLHNVPEALGNTFLRPFIFESSSPLMLISGLENLLFIGLLLLGIVFMKPLRHINWNLLLFCLSFVVILFLLTGWVTPVMGAIVRYKVPVLPFLVMIFLLLMNKEKLVNKIRFLKFLNE